MMLIEPFLFSLNSCRFRECSDNPDALVQDMQEFANQHWPRN